MHHVQSIVLPGHPGVEFGLVGPETLGCIGMYRKLSPCSGPSWGWMVGVPSLDRPVQFANPTSGTCDRIALGDILLDRIEFGLAVGDAHELVLGGACGKLSAFVGVPKQWLLRRSVLGANLGGESGQRHQCSQARRSGLAHHHKEDVQR